MSLNTSHAQGGVLIFAMERILIYYNGIEMQFEGPPGMPHFKGKKKGRVYLTTHRVIFNNSDAKDTMQSFSFPFLLMRGLELEQPVFGCNHIKGKIHAEQYGNWDGEAKFKMYFTEGGAIEFGQAMLKAASMASKNNRAAQPPAYAPPAYDNFYAAPPPAYQPPTDSNYAWVPYNTFPTAPPANSVYMTEAPPPYPGVVPTPMNAADAKAMEAAGNGYYNPSAPHMVYASAPQYNGPPPAYDQATKKND